MTYKVFKYDDWLIPVEGKLTKEDLKKYGEQVKVLYDNYDTDKSKEVGFILDNGYYAIKEPCK